ncbi:MAG: hypothetical protein JKY37_06975 [Nannocystaceae bacterium]|nr:hypothetical protein [Nannocystaceae bacterium]
MKYLPRLLALPIALIAACQNNTIELDFDTESNPSGATVDGTGQADTGLDDSADTGVASVDVSDDGPRPMPGIAGYWLLATSTQLDPSLPFQFLVLAEEIEPGLFNLTMTSLSLEPGSTTSPRQLVGEPKIFFGVPLTPDTGFEIFTGPLLIPGAANPISGTDVTVDILLSGMPTGQPYCGAVSGSVTAPTPADLGGSTFGTEKVTDNLAALPTTFATGC